jgi:uncharacterized damage-inducible protein DinB
MILRSRWLKLVALVVTAAVLLCSNQAGSAPRIEKPSTDRGTVSPPTVGGSSAQLAELRQDWRDQKAVMMKLANAMPAEKFGYRPTPAQRTYGEQILHVAGGNVAVMKLLGGTRQPPKHVLEGSAKTLTKKEIVKALSEAYDYGEKVLAEQTAESINMRLSKDLPSFGGSTRARVVWSLLSHAMDIYGQMVVYARLNGIVPPASRGI